MTNKQEDDFIVKTLVDNVTNNVYFQAGFKKGQEDEQKRILEIIKQYINYGEFNESNNLKELYQQIKEKNDNTNNTK